MKKITVLVIIIAAVISAAASNKFSTGERNLQVLPKDISDEKLDSIMNSYNVALGVNCKFCHKSYANFPDSLDYPADGEPMKAQARKMIQMNIYINKTYFYFDKNEKPEYLKTVHCNTCHRGEAFPEY